MSTKPPRRKRYSARFSGRDGIRNGLAYCRLLKDLLVVKSDDVVMLVDKAQAVKLSVCWPRWRKTHEICSQNTQPRWRATCVCGFAQGDVSADPSSIRSGIIGPENRSREASQATNPTRLENHREFGEGRNSNVDGVQASQSTMQLRSI